MEIEQTLPLQFVKKSPYTGSYKGMRFRLWMETVTEKIEENGEEKETKRNELVLCVYPEPFAFDKTPEEKKKYFRYPFSQESYEEAYRQINLEYEADYQKR